MDVAAVVTSVTAKAEDLRSKKAANEANTKALVIEPLLAALGWNLSDVDSVSREVQVYDGTFLDYALKVDAVPRIYVEAKSLSGNLDDKKFVAQAVNYANNDGVVWCVLTNGLRWRVFKTNEPASMDQKLLFEVDLGNAEQASAQKVHQLAILGHASVSTGRLDGQGERFFTDARVRAALSALAAAPPEPFLGALAEHLGHPPVPPPALRRSLARVLDASVDDPTSTAPPTKPQTAAEPKAGAGHGGKGSPHLLDTHLAGKGALVRELWEAADGHARALGQDVSRSVNKMAITYVRGKRRFFSAKLQLNRVQVHFKLDPAAVTPWNADAMRDVTGLGHHGVGPLEYSLVSVDQLVEVRALIDRAYVENQ